MSASIIQIEDKSVVYIDCSNKTPDQINDIKETLQEARNLLTAFSEKSAYIITDLTKSRFNPDLVHMFNDFIFANTKIVKESVLVGLSDHHKVIMTIFQKLHKRTFLLADTVEDAKKYLSWL